MVRFEDERDGRWYDTVAYPIVVDVGEVTRIAIIARDITERKKAEDALRESEEHYHQLVDISPDAVLIHIKGKITYLNRAALCMLGAKDSNEILGKNVLDLIHPDFRDTVRKNIEKDLKGETTPPTELVMLRVDGTTIVAEGRGVKTTFNGKPAIQVAIWDTTERKLTEDKLRESEERLRLILDSTDDLVIMQDLEGRYLYFNSAARYGVTGEEMPGLTPYNFIDRVSADRIVKRVKKVVKTGQRIREETPLVWKGQTLWFNDNLVPVKDANDTITAVVTISQNITERKRAEGALHESVATARALINSPIDSVILTDTRGIILALNETAAASFGKASNDLIGVLADNLLPKEIARTRRLLIEQVLKNKKMVRFEDQRDGSWYDTVAYPIMNESGEVFKIAIIAHDVTDRRNNEEAQIQSV